MLKQLQIIETEINNVLNLTSLNDPQINSLLKIKETTEELLDYYINE